MMGGGGSGECGVPEVGQWIKVRVTRCPFRVAQWPQACARPNSSEGPPVGPPIREKARHPKLDVL